MTVRILIGDARQRLKELPDDSVHFVVTSPPYWGLRDYGCTGQVGLEPTFDEFVEEIVGIFRECRRVLRSDGTCWMNLGDSYVTNPKGHSGFGTSQLTNGGEYQEQAPVPRKGHTGKHGLRTTAADNAPHRSGGSGLKAKNLVGIPWRCAFALQADGWYLRQDIIWAKPNPMPESVTDRCTKSHEYLFLLSKSERYHYDADAIAEGLAPTSIARLSQPNLENQAGSTRVPGKTNGSMKAVAKLVGANGPDRPSKGVPNDAEPRRRGLTPRHTQYTSSCDQSGLDDVDRGMGRNKRSVWTVATQPFKEAHFATFPPALIEPCIKAGCPVGGTVLDPFGGAGTTGLVAEGLQRNAVLIELNPEYAEIAKRRIDANGGMFADTRIEQVPTPAPVPA